METNTDAAVSVLEVSNGNPSHGAYSFTSVKFTYNARIRMEVCVFRKGDAVQWEVYKCDRSGIPMFQGYVNKGTLPAWMERAATTAYFRAVAFQGI